MLDDDLDRIFAIGGIRRLVPRDDSSAPPSDSAVGTKDGFIISAWFEESRRGLSSAGLRIRFEAAKTDDELQNALKPIAVKFDRKHLQLETENTSWESTSPPTGESTVENDVGQSGEAETSERTLLPDSITWTWNYRFDRPAPDRIVELFEATLEVLKSIVKPLSSVCEICKKTPLRDLTLCDGFFLGVGYYCLQCQKKVLEPFVGKMQAYESEPVHNARGLLAGILSALLVGSATGYLAARWMPTSWLAGHKNPLGYLFFLIFILSVGALVLAIQWLTLPALGRLDSTGATIVIGVSFGGIVVANLSYYVFVAQQRATWFPHNFSLMRTAWNVFIDHPARHVVALLATLFIGAFSAFGGIRHAIPSPDVVFEPLRWQ